ETAEYIKQKLSEEVSAERSLCKYEPSKLLLKQCVLSRLSSCNLSESSCEALSSVLSSSSLTVLDLSNNDLKDSGLKMLSVGLKSPHCKLQQLRSDGLLFISEGCDALASALRSNPSHLTDLDLRYNHPGDTGVQLLTSLQENNCCIFSPSDFCQLFLDSNSAQTELKLSDNNKKATRVEEKQPYPDHQDRFDIWPQLLCGLGLTGRCYWEVQWSGHVHISVCYRGISRNGFGNDCVFGLNALSWSLECSERVAVYVDCAAGSLSFYTVSSGQLIHLHTFNTMFTEALLPGFMLCDNGSSVAMFTSVT
uniref:SPRY-associated domain-containing protein n=1 Tax=Neogobius melanostomus TaxID=47308 RepID=A0A8C6TBN8_9GOBI